MDFRNAPTIFVHMHKSFSDRAREMSRERSRGQPGTIESGSSHGNGTLQVRTTASLANTSEAYARVSSQALKSGSSLARNSVQRQEMICAGGEGGAALDGPAEPVAARSRTRRAMDRQCPEAAESGWTSDYSRVAASGGLAMARRRWSALSAWAAVRRAGPPGSSPEARA